MLPFGLGALGEEIVRCRRCPRLAEHLTAARASYPDYWCRPVPGFGDPDAWLLIIGLAPGFHGANRHGRVFTGDDSGAWLWRALHELGLCSSPTSRFAEERLELEGVYVTNAVRCAPPANRPVAAELEACRPFLERELGLLTGVRAALCLGHLAHGTYLRARCEGRRRFAHGAEHRLDDPPVWLVDSYHPSRQNTNTGRLTWEMWTGALSQAWTRAEGDG